MTGVLDKAPEAGSATPLAEGERAPRGRCPPAARPDGPASPPRRFAALDLGTNNCRLLIAEPRGRGFRVVDGFSRVVRLGQDLGRSGRLAPEAMDRALAALAVCRGKIEGAGVSAARLIATEACRSATNGADFVSRVEAETGLALECIDRATEARLAVAGCAPLIDRRADGAVLFDIGGGSSEIVWVDLTGRHRLSGTALTRCIRAWTSLPVGVVTLAERHGGAPVDGAAFEDMVADVEELLGRVGKSGLDEVVRHGDVHLLGTSGTVTTLAGVFLGLERYDRRRVDGTWLDRDDVDRLVDQVVRMSFAERCANPCIGTERAELVLAGCAILEAIRRRWPCRRLRVADRGLREGMLMELIERDELERRRSRRRAATG